MATGKMQFPDGKGGWTEIEGEVMEGGSVDAKKQTEVMGQAFMDEAGKLTEKMFQFARIYCKENGLTPQHLAFATQLLAANLRQDFPKDYGGSGGFDTLGRQAWDYYDAGIAARAAAPKKG